MIGKRRRRRRRRRRQWRARGERRRKKTRRNHQDKRRRWVRRVARVVERVGLVGGDIGILRGRGGFKKAQEDRCTWGPC
jgi:hypothetical protein